MCPKKCDKDNTGKSNKTCDPEKPIITPGQQAIQYKTGAIAPGVPKVEGAVSVEGPKGTSKKNHYLEITDRLHSFVIYCRLFPYCFDPC